MTSALYAGSFHPIHLGHLALIEAVSPGFETLFVAVAGNPQKRGSLLSIDERVELVERSTRHLSNVVAVRCDGLVAPFARMRGAEVLVRGVGKEQRVEFEMAAANLALTGLRTVFLLPQNSTSWISSRDVRAEYAARGVEGIVRMVPPAIAEHLATSRPRLESAPVRSERHG